MAAKSTEKKSFFGSIKGFFKNLKAEFRKVVWPTKEQIWKQSVAVIVISAIMCGFIRLVDVLTQLLIKAAGSIF